MFGKPAITSWTFRDCRLYRRIDRRPLTRLEILAEILQQRLASLVRLDAAEVQDERIRHAQCSEIRVDRGRRHRLDPAPDDAGWRERTRRPALNELGFLGRQKHVTGGQREQTIDDVHPDERILFGCRNQDRAIGDERQTEEGLVVAVGPEQHAIVLGAVLPQVLDELGHLGPVLDEPLFLFFGRRARGEDDLADVREPAEMALPRDRKPPHGQRARLARRRADTRCATSRSPARSW